MFPARTGIIAVARLDITDSITWEEDLPRPQWELLADWVEDRVGPHDRFAAWTDIAKQWLEILRAALGGDYWLEESEHFLVLASEGYAESLLYHAERCRHELLAKLPEVVAFASPGKQVVLALASRESYYAHLAVYYPDGHYGDSSGMHVREGYPHIALWCADLTQLERTVAHEMTHAALTGLSLPQWVEEGLAQMFEQDVAGPTGFAVNEEQAREHKRFWKKHGLEMFWRGEGFHRPDKGQRLSYQLAEILLRLLSSEYRPRWLGLDQGPRRRLLAFLREASASDCGREASREHLGVDLGELASRFLGPGDWSPRL